MMKTVLITGVNGFVGTHLAHELHEHGITVIGIGGPRGHTHSSPDMAHYRTINLMDRKVVDSIDFRSVDGIIHLAGLASAGVSFNEPLLYLQTNLGLEVNIYEAAMAQGARPRVLVISSGAFYDPKAKLPFTETSQIVPSSPYAISKLGQEQLAAYYKSRDFDYVIARPFNHIGPGQSPGFLVPDITQQVVAIERGEAQEIMVGNLDAKRDYTDVRDIVKAYRLLLEKGQSGETYNISSGVSHDGNTILRLILEAAHIQPVITRDLTRMRPSDAPNLYGSYRKLHEHTGWEPKIELRTTLSDVLGDWRDRQA